MSTTVDERVVQMRFDNQQFENNVQTSIGTLNNLKEALHFDKVDMGSVASNIEKITDKVTGFHGVMDVALNRISNKIVDVGQNIAKAFVFNPPTDGFNEYELKMNSLKVIMESSHQPLETVNKYLNELNTYSDKTIYSFSDMTSSIGKFTNAGVDLDTAVNAIKGIANEAALAGASTNDASRAMYNFAQALSAGSVKLIDWKSIENANMATQEFKQSLIDTAVELGAVVKVGDKYQSTTANMQGKTSELFTSTKGFNESLAHQWMTTEVLTTTLGKYADETTDIGARATKAATEVRTFSAMMDALKEAVGSGWAQTWEILFGNLEEATKFWTSVNEVVSGFIDKSADARNSLLQGWKDLGGRTKLLQGLTNIFETLKNVVEPFSDAMKVIFPPITAKRLVEITDKFVGFTKKIKDATDFFPMRLLNPSEPTKVQKGLSSAGAQAEKFGSKVSNAVKITKDAFDGANDSVKKSEKTVDEAADKTVDSIDKIREAVRAVVKGDYGNGMPGDRYNALKQAGFDPDYIQNYVNKLHEMSKGNWDLSDEMMVSVEKSLGITEKAQKASSKAAEETVKKTKEVKNELADYEVQVSEITAKGNILTSILVSIGAGIKNSVGSGLKIIGAFGRGWRESFSSVKITLGQVQDFYKALDKFSSGLKISDKTLSTIQNTAKNFFTTLKSCFDIVMLFVMSALPHVLEIGKSIVKVVGGIVLGVASFISSAAAAIAKSGILEKIVKAVGKAFEAVSGVVQTVAGAISYLGSKFSDAGKHISDYLEKNQTLQKIGDGLGKGFDKLGGKVQEFGGKLGSKIGINTLDDFKAKVDNVIGKLSEDFLVPGFERLVQFIEDLVSGNLNLDKVTKFFTDAGKGIGRFVKGIFISENGTTIFDRIGNMFSGSDPSGKLSGFANTLKSVGNVIKSFFSGIFEGSGLKNLLPDSFLGAFDKTDEATKKISKVSETTKKALDGVSSVFGSSNAGKNIGSFVGKLNEADKALPKTLPEKLKSIITNGWAKLFEIFGKVEVFVAKIDFKKVLLAAFSIRTIASVFNGIKLTKSLSGMADNIGGFFEKLSKDGINVLPKESKFSKMLKIAASIFLVAKAIEMIGNIPKDRFSSAVAVVAGIAAVLTGITIALEKVKPAEGADLGGAAKTMLGMSIAIYIIAKAMEKLGKMKPASLLAGGAAVSAIVFVLSKATKSLKDLKLNVADALAPIGFALALKMLAKVVLSFGEAEPADLLQGIIITTLMLQLLKGCAKSLKDLKAGPADVLVPIAFATALGMLLVVTLAYSLIPIILLAKGFIAVNLALGMLKGAAKSLKGLNLSAADVLAPLAFAAALLLLVGAVLAFGLMPRDVLVQGGIVLVALGGLLLAMVLAMAEINKHVGNIDDSMIFALIPIALALGILAVACIPLSLIPPEKLETGRNAILCLGGILSAMILVLSLISNGVGGIDKSVIFGMIASVAAIALLGTVAVALGVLPLTILQKGEEAVFVIGGILTAMTFALGKTSPIQPSVILGMMASIVAITLLGVTTVALGLIPLPILQNGEKAILAIGAILTAMTFILGKLTEAVNIKPTDILAVVAIVLAMQLLALSVVSLGVLPVGVVQQGTVVLGFLALFLGALTYVLGKMDFSVASVLAPLAVVAAVMILVQAVQTLGSMDSGQMAQGTFGVVALLVGLSIALSALCSLAAPLIILAEAFLTFAAGAALIGAAFLMISVGMLAFAAALTVISTIDPKALLNGLMGFIPVLVVLTGAVIAAVMAIMATSAAIPSLLALGATIFLIGSGIYLLVSAFEKFILISGLIGFAILQAVKSIVEYGGQIVRAIGEGLAKAGAYIKEHAPEIAARIKEALGKAVAYVRENAGPFLSAGISAIGGLIRGIGQRLPEIASRIKEALGKAGAYIAEHGPEWLAKGLELVGNLVSGIITNAPKIASEIGKGLLAAAKAIGEKVKDWQKAGNDLVDGLLKGLGQKVKDIGDKAKDVGKKALDAIKNFLGINSPSKVFAEVGENMGAGLVQGMDTTTGDVETASVGMGESAKGGLLDGLKGFADKLSSLFSDTKSTINEESSDLSDAGRSSMDNFASGVEDGMGRVKEATTKGMTSAVEAVNSTKSKWKTAGSKVMESLASGIKSKSSKVKSAAKDAAKKGADGAKDAKGKFKDAGKSLSDGLAKGIRDHGGTVKDAARQVARDAYNAAKATLKVNSPSKLFAVLGRSIDEGLVKGMNDQEGDVVDKSRSVVESMYDESVKALSVVGDLINSDIMDDPVIRPVVDLSNAEAAADQLYSMMEDADQYSFHGNIDLAADTSRSVAYERQSKRAFENDILGTLIDGLSALKQQNEAPRGNTYIIDGITYEDGSNVATAIDMLVRAAKVGGRA